MRCTGIRPGEAAGLKWSDFDYNAMSVKIRRALSSDLEYKELHLIMGGVPIFMRFGLHWLTSGVTLGNIGAGVLGSWRRLKVKNPIDKGI